MRVAALADLHGRLEGVVVPPCDLVVIAGDLSPYGWKEGARQVPWLEAVFAPWLERIAAEAGAPVVGIAGNRDFACGGTGACSRSCPGRTCRTAR